MTRRYRPGSLALFVTQPFPCPYLPDREAVSAVVDPHAPMDPLVYSLLTQQGFRRSGDDTYRPYCPGCQACIPVRVPAATFERGRRHRRIWQRNRQLVAVLADDPADPELFSLYRRYLEARHPGGGMDDSTPEQYREFLLSRWSRAGVWRFEYQGRLLAAMVIDPLVDGWSAVYSFFDPDERGRSLGIWMILWAIEQVRVLGLPCLYLGYWIDGAPKMAYKAEFAPQQRLLDGRWVTARAPGAPTGPADRPRRG